MPSLYSIVPVALGLRLLFFGPFADQGHRHSIIRIQNNAEHAAMTKPDLSSKLAAVYNRIRLAAEKCHRHPNEISLLAVSKTRSSAEIREIHRAGARQFGENYLQECQAKQAELADLKLEWHFIGPLQSNKCRQVASSFDWVHSIDRAKTARRLSELRPDDYPALNCCIQVNIDNEASKSGVEVSGVDELADIISGLPGLRLRGLMAIPRASEDYNTQFHSYSRVADLGSALRRRHPSLDTLSMGMSSDLEAAIAAGSTLVRVGTDLFGPRN
jgi:pyridoxal phosphate enzyme (YggS family)